MQRDEHDAARRWMFRCDRCDHWYRAFASTRSDALDAARTNGWIVDPVELCPGCASVAATSCDGPTAAPCSTQ